MILKKLKLKSRNLQKAVRLQQKQGSQPLKVKLAFTSSSANAGSVIVAKISIQDLEVLLLTGMKDDIAVPPVRGMEEDLAVAVLHMIRMKDVAAVPMKGTVVLNQDQDQEKEKRRM